MRSISCIVSALKYDSPQLGHDHIGIDSITSSAAPFPKLRVTCFSCNAPLPQCAHFCSTEVGSDDDKLATEADFNDGFGGSAVERDSCNDAVDFTGLGVVLALDDLAREDDVFEVEDSEVVIVKLFGCVS